MCYNLRGHTKEWGETMYKQIEGNIYTIPVPLPGNPLKCLNSYVICPGTRSNA